MEAMKALGQALQAGMANSYERLEKRAPEATRHNLFKRWLVSLLGKEEQETTYTARSVGENLVQDYGESIGKRIMSKAGKRPLTARRIVNLHNKAARMRGSVEKKNRQHGKEWGNMDHPNSMAAQLFTRTHGFSSSVLPDYEKARLSQHIEQSFFQWDHQLSRGEAQALMLNAFHKHSTGFAEVAPETARMLGRELGSEQLYPETFALWQNRQPLSAPTRNLLHHFRVHSSHSARLQWQSPFDELDRVGWLEQIRATETHIKKLEATARHLLKAKDLPVLMQQAMVLDLHRQVATAKDHIQYLQALQDCDYRSPANMFTARMHNLVTAQEIIKEALADKEFPDGKHEDMLQLLDEVELEINSLRDDPNERVVFMKKAVNVHARGLRDRLVKAGLSSRVVHEVWMDASRDVSNATEWRPIEKTLPIRTDQGVKLYKGRIIPASQMRLTVPGQPVGDRDPFTIGYGGSGRSSATRREAKHAVNLGQTVLSTDDDRVLYKGLRSGTLTPPPDTPHIEHIVENRAIELLQAAIVQRLGDLPADQQQRILSGEEPISFDLISISMLSPDVIRHKTGIHDDEYAMQELQVQTLARLCSEPLSINVIDSAGNPHHVTANIRATTLNIPVNNLGLNPVLSTVGRVWQRSDSENDSGFSALFGNVHPDADLGGIVGEWLAGAGADSPDRDKVEQLAQQIRTIYSRGDHHSEGMDAYKLIERVQLLAFMIGAVVHSNCKSGKDRTGEGDARVRQLASEVDRLGYVPDYNAPLTKDHREAVQTFLFGAGSAEVQMQNINVPAFKTATGKDEIGKTLFNILH